VSETALAVQLLDSSDVEEIERDLKRCNSVAGSVSVKPEVNVEQKRERKRRISIPADDVGPAQPPAVESSWVTMLYPVDLDDLVDTAFSPERLARVPEPRAKGAQDDEIDVDIEFDEVPSVERQAATSGEIAVPDAAASPQGAPPTVAESSVDVSPIATAPPPTPVDAAAAPPPPPPKEAASPPPPPKGASGPPPVPLSVFTGKPESVESPDTATADGAERASAPPPMPVDVVEQIDEEDADEAAFEGEGSTSVDEVQPLDFPDDGTPPPIPPGAAAPLAASEGALAGEAAPSEAGAAPAAEGAPPAAPPEIPSDAKGGAPPVPAVSPPAVPMVPAAAPKKKRPKKFKKPWFEEFFDDDYLRTIPFMTPTYTVKEMKYIRSHLDLPSGAKLLDVGCGYGRLAIEFARVGYEVTGLDTSLPLMFLAAEASTEAGVEVNFMHQDMREMSFDGEFDGVYCVMTSFGYFDDDTNRDVVGRMYRALKPGGKFFIEVINRDFIVNDLPSRVWWEGDDCVVMDEVEFNFLTSRIVSKRSVVFSDGRSVNHDLSIRAYCLHELGRLAHNAGFRVVSVTGNINTDNRFFGQHSPYLIVVAEKK